jgi:hypothetical protein
MYLLQGCTGDCCPRCPHNRVSHTYEETARVLDLS